MDTSRKKLPGCIAIVAILYGIIVNVYLVTHYTCGDCIAPTAQANYVAPWLLGSTIVISMGLVIFTKQKRFSLLLLPGVIIFFLWYGESYLPKDKPVAEGKEFTAATFNIYRYNKDNDRIIEVIREIDADVIALQEVNPEVEEKIGTDLADVYPHTVVAVRDEYEGMALLSKFPILESHIEERPKDNEDVDLDQLVYIRAVIEADGRSFVVYIIHPPIADVKPFISYNDEYLREEVEFAINAMKQETLPLILLCDCNSVPLTRQHRELEKILDDAFISQGRGLGLTFRLFPGSPLAFLRIDYIWHDAHFAPMEIKVWQTRTPSDHYPVWAKLILKE